MWRVPIEQARRHQWEGPVLFRVTAVSYAISDGWGDWGSTSPRLEVESFEVHKWTECGATLKIMSGARRKWVDLQPKAKQWASRTIDEAVEQFRLRRQRQIYILKRQLARAEYEMGLATLGVDSLIGLPLLG